MGIIRELFRLKPEAEFSFNSSEPIPSHAQWHGLPTSAGVRVNKTAAYGLPAYQRGVRLISETIAAMDLDVYVENPDGTKTEIEDDIAELIEEPIPRASRLPVTGFDVWSYVIASMIDWGNGLMLKQRDTRGRIVGLYPLNPARVRIEHTPEGHRYTIRQDDGGQVILSQADVLHITGLKDERICCGASIISATQGAIGVQVARQDFEARYLSNDASPSVLLKHPGNPTEQQKSEAQSWWNRRHAGSSKAGSTGVLTGGWDFQQIPVNMRDAQFIESSALGVRDIARILGIPAGLLDDVDSSDGKSIDEENTRFLVYGLTPWMTRIVKALERDVDLFPGGDRCVRYNPEALLRVDLKTLLTAAHQARQAGLFTANELRPFIPFGPSDPLPDGNVLQVVPVGAGPQGTVPTNNQQESQDE